MEDLWSIAKLNWEEIPPSFRLKCEWPRVGTSWNFHRPGFMYFDPWGLYFFTDEKRFSVMCRKGSSIF